MKKFLLSFLCFLLAISGGYAEEVTDVLNRSTTGITGTNYSSWSGKELTSAAVYAGQSAGGNSSIQLRSSNSNSGIITTTSGGKVKKIVVVWNGNTTSGRILDVYGKNTAYSSPTDLYKSGTQGTKLGSIKYGTSTELVITGDYEYIGLRSNSGAMYLTSISITWENGETGGEETPVAPSAPTLTPSCSFDNEMSVEITNISEGSTVYYTTDESTPSASNGTVYTNSFKITETTTVKAIAVKGELSSEVVSGTYTKIDPNAKTGTISFASADQRISQDGNAQVWRNDGITFTNNKASSQNEVVSNVSPVRLYAGSSVTIECSAGNITQILFDCNNGTYAGDLKNSIGDAATVSSDKVTVNLDGTSNSFEIAKLTKQVRLDELTVTYSAGATKPVAPTLTAGGNFVSSKKIAISCDTEGTTIYYTTDGSEPTESSEEYVVPFEINDTTTVKAIAINDFGESEVVTATYNRVAAAPTITFDGETKVVTIKAAEGTTVYYTLNGKTPNNNSDECPENITLKADATLKVIAYEGKYKSNIVEQKFTLASSGSAESSTGTATLVTDVADLEAGDQVVIVASDYDFALSTNQKTNNRDQVAISKYGDNITLNNDVQILTLEAGTVDNTYAFNTGDGYLYAAGGNKNNYLKTAKGKDATGSWTIEIADSVAIIKAQGNCERNWLMYNFNSDLFSCYEDGQQDVSLYEVTQIEKPVLKVSSVGWATLYLGYNVVIPEDVTCYVASEINGESVKLEEVTDVLPANTAVIVKAAKGEYIFEVTKETAAVESEMKGTTKNEYITEEAYVLANGDDGVALYKVAMNGGVFLNNANKAYLPASLVSQTQNAKALKFNFDTTGVEGVKVETENKKVIYDLSGRRMNEMTAPGLYIVNGKKVMVK